MKQNKQKTFKHKKRFMIFSSLAICGLAGAVVGSCVTLNSTSHNTTSPIPINESSTKGSFLYTNNNPLTFNLNNTTTIQNSVLISKSNFDDLTPMYFYANQNIVQTNTYVLDSLNNMSLNFLNSGLSSNLQIKAYVVSNSNTITPSTSNVSLSAIYIVNPNQDSNVLFSFTGGYVSLKYNQGVWIYGLKNGNSTSLRYEIEDYNSNSLISANFLNEDLSPILSLDNLYNTFSSTGKTPTLPKGTYLTQAQKYLLDNYQDLFLSDFSALINWLNNTPNIKVEAQGTQAIITFKDLTTDFSKITFNVSNNQVCVTIPGLTATMNIDIPSIGLKLELDLNQPSFTVELNAFVAYQTSTNSAIYTVPSISNNALDDVTFNNNTTLPNNAINQTFAYGFSNNIILDLYKGSQAFTLQKVSLNYLWTNLWMLSHPNKISYTLNNKSYSFDTKNAFGSVYNGGNISIAPNSTSTPVQWSNLGNYSITNSIISINQSDYNALIDLYKSNEDNTYTFTLSANETNSTLNAIYQTILNANSFLNKLPSFISFSFNVVTTNNNGDLSVSLNSINLYNNSDPNNDNADLAYTVNINGDVYPIYNTYGTDYVSATINTQQTFSIILNKDSSLGILNLQTSINVPNSLINLYLYDSLFESIINNSSNSNYDTVNNAFLASFNDLLNNKDFSITSLGYDFSNATPSINSIAIKNNTNTAQELEIGKTLITILGNSTFVYKLNTPITINGLCSVFSLNDSFNVGNYDNGNYNQLIASNFSANSTLNTDTTHNNDMLNFLNNMILNNNNNANSAMITAYTSSTNPKTPTSLTLTSLTIHNPSNAFYYEINSKYYLIKQGTNTITLNFTLTNLAQQLASPTYLTLNNYLDQIKTYLASLSIQQLTDIISNISNIDGTAITSSMPSATTLTYSDFKISIDHYNTSSLTFDITDFNWDISGEALHIPLLGTYPISTGVSISDQSIPVQIVPVIYYVNSTNNQVESYPSITYSATDKFSEDGVSKKVGINTSLAYDYSNINLNDMKDPKMGFFLNYVDAVPNQSAYYGDGLALPTIQNSDHSAEPYLNFSYAFNSDYMAKSTTSYGISSAPSFKSYTPDVADINVYGEETANVDLEAVSNLDLTTSYNFLTFINAFYNEDFLKQISSALDLSSYLSLVSYTMNANQLTGLYIKNNSHISYLMDETNNNEAIFLTPEDTTYIALKGISYDVSSMNTATIDLSQQKKDDNSYTQSFFKAVRYLADDYGYIYPILWTQDNDNCLSYSFWGADYYWNQGTKSFTNSLSSWKAYISTGPIGDHRTVTMQMIGGLMFDTQNSTLANALSSYTGYVNKSNEIVFTSIILGGITFNNLNITIQAGKNFSLT